MATTYRPCCEEIRPKLSAGRVQSVAVRLIVERERQRMAFRSATYWDLVGHVRTGGETFDAQLVSVDGRKIPAGRTSIPATGQLKDAGSLLIMDEQQAADLGGEAPARGRHRVARVGRQALYDGSPIRPLPPARCSRRPTANTASPRGGRWMWRKPLRERAHHLHAHRLDEPGQRGDRHSAEIIATQYGAGLLARCPAHYQTK